MAGGWTRDGAVQDQIDDTVSDAVSAARSRMPKGESAHPLRRMRRADSRGPARSRCPACAPASPASRAATGRVVHSTINRRGSKDSQLR